LGNSAYVDVRGAALYMALQRPGPEGAQFLADCFLDDDIEIRTTAIQYAVLKRIPEWPSLLQRSLQDPAFEIQRAAAQALLGADDPQAQTILREYLPRCPNPELAALIRAQLNARRPPSPAGMPPSRIVRPVRPAPPAVVNP